ncbi:MAG: NADH-quinone oxidoreductase subunit J [Chloroflexi bacterium]|nr:MAG: NADH-quinone oxidoreductase subunit J [Chloroflexota bacterium]
MIVPQIVFWVMAVIAVLGGLGVIASRQPVRSVLSLVAVMLALSVIFLLLSAQFVFAVQVIVYAGAVMVLFLFVVALLGPGRERVSRRLRLHWAFSLLVGLSFFGVAPDKLDMTFFGTVEQIGTGLFTTYLYPFELTSILLLVAAVGAIYLSRGGRTASEVRRQEEAHAEEDNVA